MNYKEAHEYLAAGRNQDDRPIGNNTRLQQRGDGDIAVRLHNTDILLFKPNGDIVLNSGRWKTVTTKARMNENLTGWTVWAERGAWYIGQGYGRGGAVPYADGMVIHADGTISGEGEDPAELQKLAKRISTYARKYVAAFLAGEVPAPSSADCLYCQFRIVGSDNTLGEKVGPDHLLSHIEENYFVPALLQRALEVFPQSAMAAWGLAEIWNGSAGNSARIVKGQYVSALRRYLRRECGLA